MIFGVENSNSFIYVFLSNVTKQLVLVVKESKKHSKNAI